MWLNDRQLYAGTIAQGKDMTTVEPGSSPAGPFQPRCAPGFAPLLERFDRRALDDNRGTVFGLWSDFRLAYANAEWFRFAAANGGEPAVSTAAALGKAIMSAIPADLQPYYRYLYALANTRDPRHSVPLCHEYDCSSAETYRRFAMQIYTLEGYKGFLVVNSLLIERPHDPGVAVLAPREEDYLDANGLFCQCSHCRRYLRNNAPESWDWVPAWVERQPRGTSHGLCRICFDYYYPKGITERQTDIPPGAIAPEA
jgi:hypothetical protein